MRPKNLHSYCSDSKKRQAINQNYGEVFVCIFSVNSRAKQNSIRWRKLLLGKYSPKAELRKRLEVNCKTSSHVIVFNNRFFCWGKLKLKLFELHSCQTIFQFNLTCLKNNVWISYENYLSLCKQVAGLRHQEPIYDDGWWVMGSWRHLRLTLLRFR